MLDDEKSIGVDKFGNILSSVFQTFEFPEEGRKKHLFF
jgi:hypothetical protein